jgi:hypothetical protein
VGLDELDESVLDVDWTVDLEELVDGLLVEYGGDTDDELLTTPYEDEVVRELDEYGATELDVGLTVDTEDPEGVLDVPTEELELPEAEDEGPVEPLE